MCGSMFGSIFDKELSIAVNIPQLANLNWSMQTEKLLDILTELTVSNRIRSKFP